MTPFLEIIAGVFIIIGSVFIFLTSIGLVKMPDIYTRISVTTKAATIGLGLVLLGTAVFFHDLSVYARSILLIIFVFMTSPVGSHMIGRASYLEGAKLWDKTIADDLRGKYDLKNLFLKGEEDKDK